MNTLRPGTVATVLLLALLLAGCKDLFHTRESEKPKEYTVTFDAVGGSPATQTKTVTSGSSVGSSGMPSEPTMAAYIFDGWYTVSSGGGTEFTGGTLITGDITVYAWWIQNTGTQYTVTFDAAEGSPATQTKTVTSGSSVGSSNMPSTPTRSGYGFAGWYTAASGGGTEFTATTTVTGTITVYARWGVPDNLSLADALTWISSNAVTGDTYTIMLQNNETIAPKTLDYSGKMVGITLTGGTAERIISLTASGSLFTVGSGVTLTLDNNVTLQGRSNNTTSLVYVNSGGTLVLNTGSKINANTTIHSSSSSSAYSYGGGVYVNGGTCTMNGGTISGNTVSASSSSSVYSYGGGMYVASGTFTMNGGTISNNTATVTITSSTSYHIYYGGGVYVAGGTFNMNGGTISNNNSNFGGGVYVAGGTFSMSSGTISGNTAGSRGGGVCVYGTFNMSGGTISVNTASSYGGGVYAAGGIFTMNGGTISGNIGTRGGGVHVESTGTFVKQLGGVIYGSDASSTLGNTATQGDTRGHAVYGDSTSKRRNTTAGVGVTMNSGLSGSAGGWE